MEPNLTPSVALTLVVSAISDLTTSTKPCLILFEPSSLDRGVVPNPSQVAVGRGLYLILTLIA